MNKWAQALRVGVVIFVLILSVLTFGFIQFSNGYDAGVKAAVEYFDQSSQSTQQSEKDFWRTTVY